MAIAVTVSLFVVFCVLTELQVRRIEGLEAKPEQMQSVVRQQDAALSSDESGGSAAGNPGAIDAQAELVAFMKDSLDEWLVMREVDNDTSKILASAVIGQYKAMFKILGRDWAA